MVRADPSDIETLVGRVGAAPMEMKSRPITGWLRVDDNAVATDDDLARWVDVGMSYAATLPKKPTT